MPTAIRPVLCPFLALAVLAATADVQAQERRFAAQIVLPQRHAFAPDRARPIEVTAVEADVAINGALATTTLTVKLRNPEPVRVEAAIILPVPRGAIVRGFAFAGAGAEPKLEILPRDEARSTYEAIVARVRDPALLEFAELGLLRSSVFPVEARGSQAVRLT